MLWAYWPLQDANGPDLQEIVADRDMTAVEGTSGYTFTYQQPGPLDGVALEFQGKDSGIDNTMGTHSEVGISSGDATALYSSDGFTIELWFWAATPSIPTAYGGPEYYGWLASHSPSVIFQQDYWRLYLDASGNLVFDTGIWGTPDFQLTAVPNVPGQWVHAAVTYNGTAVSLYVDGGLADSGTPGSAIGSGAGIFGLGSPVGNYTNRPYFEGRIAHVALYTGALDAGTVTAHAGFSTAGSAGSEHQMLESDGAGGVRWAYPSFEVEY